MPPFIETLDGIPSTADVLHTPGPQYAARVGEPMLHGGMALPGPGSTNVNIGGRGAPTVQHAVAACPQTKVGGLPHIPQAGSWKTTNGSVFVNGAPLLRAGDWIVEHFGGCNPLVGGAPTVKAGPPARPCITQEVRYLSLPGPLKRAQRVPSGLTAGPSVGQLGRSATAKPPKRLS